MTATVYRWGDSPCKVSGMVEMITRPPEGLLSNSCIRR